MFEIEVLEAESKLGLLFDRVQDGEEILITRHGKPLARLVLPCDGRIEKLEARAAIERIRSRAQNLKIAFDWETVKADRDSGRK